MRNKKRHKVLRVFPLLIFMFYWSSITLFTHFHVVNGVVIVHSHINKTGHQHTPGEFVTILNLSTFINSTLDTSPFIPPVYWSLIFIFIPFFVFSFQKREYNNNSSRAPPTFSFPIT